MIVFDGDSVASFPTVARPVDFDEPPSFIIYISSLLWQKIAVGVDAAGNECTCTGWLVGIKFKNEGDKRTSERASERGVVMMKIKRERKKKEKEGENEEGVDRLFVKKRDGKTRNREHYM